MGKSRIFVFIAVFLGSMALGFFLWKARSSFDGTSGAPEVNWRQLGDLDYVTGHATEDLKKFDGKMVRIPGFMVPLEDEMKNVAEFLLVPSPQACIHVPPPPPNQMVFVKMETQGANVMYGPIWIYGTLHIQSKKHMYGEASFSMTGVKITPYK